MAILQIRVKPNARVSHLGKTENGQWMAQLKSAPVDGKANQELLALVAKYFDCPKSAVSLKSGSSGRMKLVKIEGLWAVDQN